MSEPVNCFLLFCKEERETISQHCKAWDNSQVTSHLGELWRAMDSKLKQQYKSRAATAKQVSNFSLLGYFHSPYVQNFAANNPNFKRKTKVESRYISSFRLSTPFKTISKPVTVKPQTRPTQYPDVPRDLNYPPTIHHPRATSVQSRSLQAFPFDTLHYYSHYCNPYSIGPCDCFINQMYK